MWSRHWNTPDPRAERKLNLRHERLFCKRGNMVQDPESRDGATKFECFPWRDTRVPAVACVQVRYREEV